MNGKELVIKYWFLTRPGDAAEGQFYAPGENPYQQFGVECGDGWIGILDELFGKVAVVVKRDGLTSFEIIQIKEKFGELRLYSSGGNDEIDELIREAVKLSVVICENCGLPGKLLKYNMGWYATQCPACDLERRLRLGEIDDDDEDEEGQRIGGDDEGEQ